VAQVSIQQQVVKPIYDTRPGTQIIIELGKHLGIQKYFDFNIEDANRLRLQPLNVSLEDLKKQYNLHVTETRKVRAPAGFSDAGWVWYEIAREIRPSERYDFQGKLYVLINGGCGSAGDDYADLVKRSKLGTLVGQNTRGGGGAI
jgi:anaerobic selenocysteine-containing dehydrogenase